MPKGPTFLNIAMKETVLHEAWAFVARSGAVWANKIRSHHSSLQTGYSGLCWENVGIRRDITTTMKNQMEKAMADKRKTGV